MSDERGKSVAGRPKVQIAKNDLTTKNDILAISFVTTQVSCHKGTKTIELFFIIAFLIPINRD